MKMENNSKLALAIVAGVGACAAAWYFMNTENGKQKWMAIVDAVKDASDKIMDAGNAQVDKITSAGKEAGDRLVSTANGLLHHAKNYS